MKLAYIYYNKCYLIMKGSVWSLKEKTSQHWFSHFQIARKY